jgi:hypothetical protein
MATEMIARSARSSARPAAGPIPSVEGASPAPPPSARAGLAVASAPPLRLPGEHFAAALLFWLAGALGLIWVAPDIAQGLFPLPRVVAVVHLFALGWITTTIMGALYQFLPVALLVPIRSERAAHASFALFVPGLILFVGGMLTSSHGTLLGGTVLFGTGLLLFAVNLAATLKAAPDRNLTWWALAGALVSLVSSVVLGMLLTGNLRWSYLGGDRFLALGVHLHVAIAGWVMLVIVGVAHRLLPMFLLSHGAPERMGRLAVGMLSAGVALLLVLHHALTPLSTIVIAALLGGGTISFLAQAALYFRHGNKPRLDPGLRLVALALGFLALGLILAPLFLTYGLSAPRLATGYVLVLMSALSLFVAGHYYKILPFLVWYHRFGPLVGKRPVPKVADLYAAGPANLAALLLGAGVFGLASATLFGITALARPAAALFAIGAATVVAQMLIMSLGRAR